jgi:hypothetical protein
MLLGVSPYAGPIFGSMASRASSFQLPLRTSLVGSDGRGATLSRPSYGWMETAAGLIVRVDPNLPRQRPDLGTLIEEARTNRLVWSRDLTNAVWSKDGITVQRVADPTALGGFVNRLTATKANAVIYQAVFGMPNAAHVGAFRLRRVSGSGAALIGAGGPRSAVPVGAAWSWGELPQPANTNYILTLEIATSGDVLEFDWAGLEDGAFRTSPVETAGLALARATSVTMCPSAGWAAAAFDISLSVSLLTASGSGVLFDALAANNGVRIEKSGNDLVVTTGNGVATATTTVTLAWVAATSYRIAASGSGGTVTVKRGGVVAGTGAAKPMPTAFPVNVAIGCTIAGASQINGWVADLEVA